MPTRPGSPHTNTRGETLQAAPTALPPHEQPGDRRLAAPFSRGDNLNPREVEPRVQGHAARCDRAEAQTQAPLLLGPPLPAPPEWPLQWEEGQGRAEDRCPRLPSRRQEGRGPWGAHLMGVGNMNVRGQPQPKESPGLSRGQPAAHGDTAGAHWGPFTVPSLLQFTRPPRLPLLPAPQPGRALPTSGSCSHYCALCPGDPPQFTPLGLCVNVTSSRRPSLTTSLSFFLSPHGP